MKRYLPVGIRAIATVVLLIACHGTAAAADAKQGTAKADGGPFENSLPLVIGGVITLGVLGFGFILLSGKQEQARSPVATDTDPYYDQVPPPHVVPAANPIRYLVGPAVVLGLLAVFVPLSYSLYKKFAEAELALPKPEDLKINVHQPTPDWSTFKPIDWQNPQFKMPQFPPPTITIQQPRTQIQQIPVPPPIHVPVAPTPGMPRR
jgi:hypothetical protein